MDRSQLAIIIPAFNEEKSILKVVEKVSSYGIVIVVDDASMDRTASLAQGAGAVVVRHKKNKGYDGALNSGFIKATELNCNYAITFDADGQHEASFIPEFINLFECGIDLVMGIRPKYARFSERLFSIYTRCFFKICDPLCGMKGYKLSIYHKRGWFDSYGSIGTELALWAIKNKYVFKQIPIPIFSRIDRPRFGAAFKANKKILCAMMNSIFYL